MARPERALARLQVEYLRSTIWLTLAYVVVPFGLIAYARNGFELYFRGAYPGATGGELVVPGVAALYAFLIMAHDGSFTFNEHVWNVWDRIRATAPMAAIVRAKLGVVGLHALAQTVVIVTVAAVVDIYPRSLRSLVLAPVLIATVLVAVSWGALGHAVCRTATSFDAWVYGGGVGFAAVGGAIAPADLLPRAVQRVAPLTPVSWTMRAARSLLLDHAPATAAIQPTLGLLAFATVFGVLAMLFFRPDQAKLGRFR
jgi:ABC-2 type transport system permease protein